MAFVNNILDTLNNPSMLHAAMVHFPVVLASLGLLLLLILSYYNDKTNLRWLAVVIYLMCSVSGWVSKITGEGAEAMVSNRLASDIWDRIGDHAQMGERVYVMAGVTLLFLIISLIEHDTLRKIMTLFSLAASLATFALVSFTAHYGGVLVYELGVGTPMSHVGYEGLKQGEAETPSNALPIREINMDEARLVSYKRDIWPIFEDRCLSCHEAPDPDGEYAMDDYAAIMTAGPKGGASVVAGKPDESSVVLYIRGIMKPQMPKKKDPLTEEQLHLIRMWIAAGAVDDSATANTAAPPIPAPVETPAAAPTAAPAPAFNPFGGDTPKAETGEVVEEKKVETPAPSFDPFGGSDATPQAAPETAPATTPEPVPSPSPEPSPVQETVPTPEPAPTETFNPFGNNDGAEPKVEKKEETFEPFGGGNIQPKEKVEEAPPAAPEKVQVPDKVEEKAPEPTKPAPIKPRRNPLFDPFST